MGSAIGNLFGFGEEVIRVAVEHHPADHAQRYDLFRDQLRRIEHVEIESVRLLFSKGLQREFPFRKIATVDRVPKVAAMKVGIGAVDLDRLVPDDRLCAELRPPVEFNEGRVAGIVDEPEGVDAEAFHHPKAARNRAVGHDPHDHVHRLRRERDVIPECVVCGLRLGKLAVRILLGGMDQVGKLDRVLNEEHRDVVADEIEVSFLGVELDREAADVTRQIRRAFVTGNGREARENWERGRRGAAGNRPW